MKSFLAFLSCLLINCSIYAQDLNFETAFSFANSLSSNTNEAGNAIASDAFGNVYASGSFRGDVDFDPTASNVILSGNPSNDNAYLAKYDSSGNIVFVHKFSATTPVNIRGNDVVVDDLGNIYYVLLSTNSTAAIDLSSIGGTTIAGGTFYILKLDNTGALLWSKILAGPTSATTDQTIVLDNLGNNLYITARHSNGTSNLDLGGTNFSISTPTTGASTFVAKYSSTGNFLWANQFVNSSGSVWGVDIDVDSNNAVYCTGMFNNTTNFGSTVLTPNGGSGEDIYVVKLNDLGNVLWAFNMGSDGNDRGQSLAIDANDNFYLGARFSRTINANPLGSSVNHTTMAGNSSGDADILLAKYTPTGSLIWSHSMGSSSGFDNITGIEINLDGDVFINGNFNGTVDFDSSSNTFNLTSNGSADVYLAAYSELGDFLDAVSFGGSAFEWGADIYYNNVLDEVYLTGNFRGTVDFDPSVASSFNITNLSSNSDDVFVSIFSVDKSTLSIEERSLDKFIISPNPTTGIVNIRNTSNEHMNKIQVYDLNGKKMMDVELSQNNLSESQLDISFLNSGIYLIKISNDRQSVIKKLVVK